MRKLTYLSLIILIVSCKKELKTEHDPINKYEDAYKVYTPSGQELLLKLDYHGNLNGIINKIPFGKQYLMFFENGNLASVSKLNDSLIIFNRQYFFYENSGNLNGDFNWVNGNKTGAAVTYYDSTARIREIMYYNYEGQLYYKEFYDRKGKITKIDSAK
jgi:antitoxin component YwqK of YwqJK toxin-antitoxin module